MSDSNSAIVSKVWSFCKSQEGRLSVFDKVEETIITRLAQAATLRQSILKKAFEGKLVTSI